MKVLQDANASAMQMAAAGIHPVPAAFPAARVSIPAPAMLFTRLKTLCVEDDDPPVETSFESAVFAASLGLTFAGRTAAASLAPPRGRRRRGSAAVLCCGEGGGVEPRRGTNDVADRISAREAGGEIAKSAIRSAGWERRRPTGPRRRDGSSGAMTY